MSAGWTVWNSSPIRARLGLKAAPCATRRCERWRRKCLAASRDIAAAGDDAIELGRDGRLRVERAAVAKLTPGAPLLKPRIELIGGERAGEGEREAARERLEFWLARKIAGDLRPLVMLETAWREGELPADARGLAFRLIENSGALDRAHEDLDHVRADAQQALKRCGVRIGPAHHLHAGPGAPARGADVGDALALGASPNADGIFPAAAGRALSALGSLGGLARSRRGRLSRLRPHRGSLRHHRASWRRVGAGGAT